MSDRIISAFRDGKWQAVEFHELRVGDQFSLFESTGEVVPSDEGYVVFKVTSEPYFSEEGNEWVVDVEPIP